MDQTRLGRRTLLGKALFGGALLFAQRVDPTFARPVPPFQRGEPKLYGTCRGIQDKYKQMERYAREEKDAGIRAQLEADMRKVDLEWRLAGCQSEFDSIAIARIPLFPGGSLGPSPIAPGAGQQPAVIVGGGPKLPSAGDSGTVADPNVGVVSGKPKRRSKRRR